MAKPEQLIVYGVNCVWWDSIEKTGRLEVPRRYDTPARMGRPGLPCCPHCGSVLMQIEESKWFANMDDYEAGRQPDGVAHPGYRKMMEWGRGKCFRTMSELKRSYDEAGQ
jgi:hypothetical protein